MVVEALSCASFNVFSRLIVMIELSSSWELQGRRKLSDVLYIKEMRLDHEAYDTDESDLVLADASIEFASKPVVLQPFLHPEVSSVGACCIMIRLSTQRQLRIVQLVLISSSPHIEFVDRYGEPLARIEGILVPDAEEELYRCSSGHLSPHTECVVRLLVMMETAWPDPFLIMESSMIALFYLDPAYLMFRLFLGLHLSLVIDFLVSYPKLALPAFLDQTIDFITVEVKMRFERANNL
ncbi:hypothetical protein Aperf_G00000092318 [Anoplocephala perfoliata]